MGEHARQETDSRRTIRVAAVGDLHSGKVPRHAQIDLFARAARDADVLALCGDLTHDGRPEQMHALVEELKTVEIPIVAVLGNHDYVGGAVDELVDILERRDVVVLDGEHMVIGGVGFAGVKGFCGGFGRYTVSPIGERALRDFVQETLNEALKLESAVRSLTTPQKIVLMHYSPIQDTVIGEPEPLFPFLGSSRFLPVLETHGATVVFHAHAHYGTHYGRSPAGIDVYNVALPVLEGMGRQFHVWTGEAPERRARPAGEQLERDGHRRGVGDATAAGRSRKEAA